MMVVKLVPRGVRPTVAEDQAVKVLSATVDPEHEHITSILVSFGETEDAEGGPLSVCRAKVKSAKALHLPSFNLEGHAETMREAAELVADAIVGSVRRALVAGKRRRPMEVEEGPPAPKVRAHRESERPTSAHPPRGRHFHMTRHQARATSAREASATRPSRKSTRKSANRSKRDGNTTARTGRAVRPVRPEARR